jgi:glycosyltransferase involved in cell wall biosynthesis
MITGTILARAVRLGMPYRVVAHVHNIHQRSSVLMGFADRLIAVSDAVAREMTTHGISAKKIRVVRNGTLGSIRLSDPDDVPTKQLAEPAIVTVAGMNHRKGISELISAFEQVCRRVPQSHLYLVGGGPDRREFEAQAMISPMSARIHFEGFQADPIPYMKAASVFVLASRRDSFPLVLPEARQCGCAIVATSVDGIPEALEHGRAGLLVPPQNPDALATAILRILEEPAEATSFRLRSRRNLEVFRVERVASQITQVYAELLMRSQTLLPNLDNPQAEKIRCA